MSIESVEFVPRWEVERRPARPDTAVVSIQDLELNPPELQPGWGASYAVHFVDGGYDEASIHEAGAMFATEYQDFINEERASKLLRILSEIDRHPGLQHLLVSGEAGRSRCAAVAQFVSETYGAALSQPTPELNQTVYELLKNPYTYSKLIIEAANADTRIVGGKPPAGWLRRAWWYVWG